MVETKGKYFKRAFRREIKGLFVRCIQKPFSILENKKHSKICVTIILRVLKVILCVFKLIFLENNWKMFSLFYTLLTKKKNIENTKH